MGGKLPMNYLFKLGNDNGNAHHDVIIDNQFLSQVNVNKQIYTLKGYNDLAPAAVLNSIFERLVVTVSSPKCKSGTYLIGQSALDSGKKPNEIMVGFDDKCTSDIPMVNTLGLTAAYAVKKHYIDEKNELNNGDALDVGIEMTTALPIREYYQKEQSKEIFSNRFLEGPHTVTVHLGNLNVKVNIEFLRVYITPEASSVYWFLDAVDSSPEIAEELFEEFKEEYDLETVSAKEISTSKILHVDIGSGTTEYPLTKRNPDPAFITGRNLGIGHAIDAVLKDFGDAVNLPEISRLEFDQILKNPNHQFHNKAYQFVEPNLMEQADEILEELKRQVRAARMDIDYILVYGGGSILLKDFLYPEMKRIAEMTEKAKVIYVPANLAVKMNAMGLNAFVHHKIFEAKTKDQGGQAPKASKKAKKEVEV